MSGSASVSECAARDRCVLLEGNSSHSAQIIQRFAATPYRHQRVRVRVRMRSDADAHLRIELERRGHSVPWYWGWDEASTDWRSMESILDVPEDAEVLTLRLAADRRAWFDDIVLDVMPLDGSSP